MRDLKSNVFILFRSYRMSEPTGCELSSLPTGCVPLQPCGDLKTSQPRSTQMEIPSRKCRFLNNLTSNHVVTIAADSKGATKPPVSVASIGVKALRFDTDPELQCLLAIRMVLVVLRTAVLAVAGNARRRLEWILPASYTGRQEENAEKSKILWWRGVSFRDLIRMRFGFLTLCSGLLPSEDPQWYHHSVLMERTLKCDERLRYPPRLTSRHVVSIRGDHKRTLE